MACLTCLGTSDSFGSAGRHCAGYLLESAASRILIDAGPGILTALKARQIDPATIDGIVLSHLHGDHFGGVPFLLLDAIYDTPRSRTLSIVGPPTTRRRVENLFVALYAEREGRELPFPVEWVELEDGRSTEIADVAVEAFRVPHMDDAISLGHRLRTAGRALVYTGDTPWTDDLLRAAAGADLLLCECTTFETVVPKHIRYVEIEANRHRFDCGNVLLTHLGREMRHRRGDVAETMADDGLRFDLAAPDLASSHR